MLVSAAAPLTASTFAYWDVLGFEVGGAVLVAGLAVLAVVAAFRRSPHRRPEGADAVSRRHLLEQGAIAVFVAAIAGVVAAALDYVVTAAGSRRGGTYTVGTPEAVRRHLATAATPYYDPVGGFYVVAYPAADLDAAARSYGGAELAGMRIGFVALDQACTHLGCRVPWCPTSRWFECPCHGSRFNGVGELERGPAGRGLDRYALSLVDGEVVVDTRQRIPGPPPGTDTVHQPSAGPHCY